MSEEDRKKYLWVLSANLPYVLAKDELRTRSIDKPLTAERAYNLVYEVTEDEDEASRISAEVSLRNATK